MSCSLLLGSGRNKDSFHGEVAICGFHNINCKYDFINAIELYFIIIFLKYVNTLDTLKLTGTFY